MESESDNFFTRKIGEGDVILHIFKVIFIALTLIIGAIIIHLEHSINTITSSESDHPTTPFDPSLQTSNPIIYTDSYIFTISLLKATELLQDAISLILSNYSASDSDISAEMAWRNCSGSLLNGWGEIQDALEHVIMNPRPSDEQRAEMTTQIIAAEGFITSCVDDLEKVESTTASEVRAKMLLATGYLSGRGDFLIISYYDDISKRTEIEIMESVRNNNLKTHLIEEDPISLAFRRRNNTIIFILLCIIITGALVLATTFFYVMHNISHSDQPLMSPAVRAYYSVAANTPSCLDVFMEMVSIKSDADPNQIFALSLQAAAQDLDITLASFVLPNSDTEPAYNNCSSSLDQIRHALQALRVNPAVETMSGVERVR
ncbi:hypothetical protein C2S51_028775 [Perilla frutescens var. frutescens]|nr:hypothetical protein C2S51_028775 [Perilla frutescens var. frutescens]